MRTPIRFQSRLLIRRSYKPDRAQRRRLSINFRSTPRFAVPVANDDHKQASAVATRRAELALSG